MSLLQFSCPTWPEDPKPDPKPNQNPSAPMSGTRRIVKLRASEYNSKGLRAIWPDDYQMGLRRLGKPIFTPIRGSSSHMCRRLSVAHQGRLPTVFVKAHTVYNANRK